MRRFLAWMIEDDWTRSPEEWLTTVTVVSIIVMLLWPGMVFAGGTTVSHRNGRLSGHRTYDDGNGVVSDASGKLKETWTRQGDSIVVRDRYGRVSGSKRLNEKRCKTCIHFSKGEQLLLEGASAGARSLRSRTPQCTPDRKSSDCACGTFAGMGP